MHELAAVGDQVVGFLPMDKPGAAPPLDTRNFPTAQEDAEKEEEVPHARYEGPESSYRLAFTDTEFLLREELRPVRMQLELLKRLRGFPPESPEREGLQHAVLVSLLAIAAGMRTTVPPAPRTPVRRSPTGDPPPQSPLPPPAPPSASRGSCGAVRV